MTATFRENKKKIHKYIRYVYVYYDKDRLNKHIKYYEIFLFGEVSRLYSSFRVVRIMRLHLYCRIRIYTRLQFVPNYKHILL